MATAVIPPASTGRNPIAPACVQFGIRFGGTVRTIEVADDDALQLIQASYAPLSCPPAGTRAHASVRRLSDGRLHVRYGRYALRLANAADPIPLRAAYHAAREIFARFACEPAESVAFYGALCEFRGSAVLLLGPTTIGKTLLSLHMTRAGAHFLGDETAVLSLTSGDIFAMARRPALRESALPLLPDSQMAQSVAASPNVFATERGRFWYALDETVLSGIAPSAQAYPLRAVCVLSARAETPAIQQVDTAAGVRLLGQRAYVRPTSLAQIAALRRATKHTAFFELTLGAPRESAALLLREVQRCG